MRLGVNGFGWKLEINQDQIEVMSENPAPDEGWRFTDPSGHEHFYDHGYPTLDFVVDERHWCWGNEGPYNHDPHWAVDRAHYECKLCGIMIEPSTLPPYTPQFIPGAVNAILEGYRSDGTWIRCELLPEELDRVQADQDVVPELFDIIPSERIYETRWGLR